MAGEHRLQTPLNDRGQHIQDRRVRAFSGLAKRHRGVHGFRPTPGIVHQIVPLTHPAIGSHEPVLCNSPRSNRNGTAICHTISELEEGIEAAVPHTPGGNGNLPLRTTLRTTLQVVDIIVLDESYASTMLRACQ